MVEDVWTYDGCPLFNDFSIFLQTTLEHDLNPTPSIASVFKKYLPQWHLLFTNIWD